MPEAPVSPSPQMSPGAPGTGQGQSPFGSSPATQATQNNGHKVAGVKMMGLGLMLLEQAVPMVGASTPEGQDLLRAITNIGKHVPPGSVTPQDINNVIQGIMIKQRQGMQQMQQMKQQQMQHAAQPQPGAGAPAAAA